MNSIPRLGASDSTIAFLREGYPFTTTRCRQLGSDAFRTRLMLSPVTCAYGKEAAEIFYAKDRFTRRGAMPSMTVKMLQGFGSVQTLDGAPHRNRKQMFLQLLMGEAEITRLVTLADEEWHEAAARWSPGARISLLDEAALVLSRVALRWLGLSPRAEDAGARARECLTMIRGAGTLGPLSLARGALLRARSEKWARRVIEDVREERLAVDRDSPIRVLANQPDEERDLLSLHVAALELLNLVRPIVAIAVFIIHAALALRDHPEWRERVMASPKDTHDFVQEVRRLAPFFPVIAGRVMEPFEWRGETFTRGDWMLLDLWGTNRDERIWDNAEAFRPERFAHWEGNAFTLIPQGGGDYADGHRCPGERVTIALTEQAVRFLASIDYSVPEQDLSLDMGQMPALPDRGLLIEPLMRG
ncbi:MAG TPA: cytochrome P450 [Paracoccaceae bacterium]|nr:cytochrome P450 [Paracoccaceae bacterium]